MIYFELEFHGIRCQYSDPDHPVLQQAQQLAQQQIESLQFLKFWKHFKLLHLHTVNRERNFFW